jgi:hypothetical protein
VNRHHLLTIVVLPNAVSSESFACDFMPGYQSVVPTPILGGSVAEIPGPPEISVAELRRGFDDGNAASCSDAGILRLRVSRTEGESIAGYLFELKNGDFPEATLSDGYVMPVLLGKGGRGFRFVWLDLPRGSRILKPIDATISVRQLSSGGYLSEPVLLHISHRGGGA